MRDFLPEDVRRRQYVIDVIADVYQRYGFEPLETPSVENIDTLLGKYGDEGDKLIFQILKRGEAGTRGEVDLALRYDLTVPLARVVAMNPGLRMPFKRYHMGPVWRADRPARGRFREFWQCDVDICGTTDTLAESECLAVFSRALKSVGFDVVLRLNDRRLLRAMATDLGVADREAELLVAIDKLDKIGVEGVDKELAERGMGAVSERLWTLLHGEDDPLERMARLLGDQPGTQAAIDDLNAIIRDAELLGCTPGQVRIDPTLARGLDYYTGPIWEAVLPGENMGSVGGGGRYDGLIGMFGKTAVPAVGCSIGLERILVLREEAGSQAQRTSAPILVTIFDSEHRALSIEAARAFREAGVGADLYADARKLSAQFKHANALGYRFTCVIGSSEREAGTVTIKDMVRGEQVSLPLAEAVEHVRAAQLS
jgi:histidyl-tRNA synthetase